MPMGMISAHAVVSWQHGNHIGVGFIVVYLLLGMLRPHL